MFAVPYPVWIGSNEETSFFYRCTVQLGTIKVFYLPTDALYISLINSKNYIKTYIKIAPTCFGSRPSSES